MGLPQRERSEESESHEDGEYGERPTIREVAVDPGTVYHGAIASKIE